MALEKTINYKGYKGSGYIILDPQTGRGAYLIDGGANGAIAMIVSALLIMGIAFLFLEVNPIAFAGLLILSAGLLTTAYGFITNNSLACQIGIETALVGAEITLAAFAFGNVIRSVRQPESLKKFIELLKSDAILYTLLGGGAKVASSFGRDAYKNRVCGWIK